jgi:hypothetical protein
MFRNYIRNAPGSNLSEPMNIPIEIFEAPSPGRALKWATLSYLQM